MSTRVLALVLPVLFAGVAFAQPPLLVEDINTTQTGGTWQPWPSGTQFVEMGGALYFMSSDGIHGTELWRTDGTAAGTRIVKDICPGSCSSWIFRLGVWGSALYFSADDGAHGNELWKSDGTEAGTVLVKDLTPGLTGSTPADFFEAGGSLYFSAFQDATGRELWKTDGTEAGTSMAVDLWPGTGTSFPRPMGRIGNTVLLNASDAAHGLELWAFDGSPSGPVLVKDINPGADGSVSDQGTDLPGYRSFLVAGGRLYFVAQDGTSGYELWASDGTAAGTVLVKDINPGSEGSYPFTLTELNGQLLFRASDADGAELWKSDGTGANTVLVKDIRPGTGNSSPSELTVLGSWVYFRASDDTNGSELWRSDGTEANTALVKDIRPGSESGLALFGPSGFAVVGTTLTFFANDGTSGMEPWKSDGTEAGTTLLADLNPGAGSSMFDLYGPVTDLRIVWGGRWYFRAFETGIAVEVYTSDGTPAGTQQLAEINGQTSAFEVSLGGSLFDAKPLADGNGTLFFQASDGVSGTELWKSDGTSAGTQQVADILPGFNGSIPTEITPLGGNVLFSASTGNASGELWISDGTEAGTSLLKDLDPGSSSGGGPQNLTPFGGQVFFTATSFGDNTLWKTNGTEAGTVPVRDLPPTALSPAELTPVGNLLFYSGEGPAGQELWRTDGTAAGTIQVADIAPGPASSSPDGLTRLGSRVFFSADDGSSGRELWTSDGVNTWRVKDIRPGTGSSIRQSWGSAPEVWAATPGRLFFKADEGTAGEELWVHDGTETSPFRLRDVFPGPRSSEIQWLTAAGERVYFVADDGVHGRELWVSKGTGAGTRMVADLVPGTGSSLPEQLTVVGQNLVFSAHTADHGREVWLTDGETVGTRRLTDLAPGPLPSSPIGFTLSGPWLYFVATDAEAGFELHSVPRESVDGGLSFHTMTPCRLLDTRAGGGPLGGGAPATFDAAGLCGIPETARALAVNVTAVAPSIPGHLILFRAHTMPTGIFSSLSFTPGRDRSSNTTVQLGDGDFSVWVFPEFNMSVHVIVDVSGYYE